MIRGQLCLYEGKTDVEGWSPSGGVGIVEAPIGSLVAERILGFVEMQAGTGHLLAPVSYSDVPVEDSGHEIHQHLTNAQWPRPAVGSGMAGGGILFRHTRAPASVGHEIMLVALCMYAPTGSVRSQMRYSVDATDAVDGIPGRISMHSPEASEELARTGIGVGQLLKQAAWGWNEEAFGFPSTLRLDIMDDAMESVRLLDACDLSAEDDERIEMLRSSPGYRIAEFGRRGHESAEFAEYRRRMGDSHRDWSMPLTATQMRARDLKADEIVRAILAEQD